MSFLTTFSEYRRAVNTAARFRPRRLPMAVYSVLLARLRYQIGPRLHSLFDLSSVSPTVWQNYLLDKQLKPRLRAVNHLSQREVTRDKLAFFLHCAQHALPTVPILCVIDMQAGDGAHGLPEGRQLDGWLRFAATAPDRMFVKLVDGTHGVDAFVAARRGTMWEYCGESGTSADLHAFCIRRFGVHGLMNRRGWIVQPLVHVHPLLRGIMAPDSLGTVRAVTCLANGRPELLFAMLRIPVGSNVTDNFAHGATGNLVAPIDLATGMLGVARGSSSRTWPCIVPVATHPDTKQAIAGFSMPFWQESCALVLQAQALLPQLRTLAWDIAVTAEGPLLLEANSVYEVNGLQVALGRGIRQQLLASIQPPDTGVSA